MTPTTTMATGRHDHEHVDAISGLFQSCASINKNARSLKALTKFEDIDAAIDQEKEIGRWLDRQLLDYTNDNDASITMRKADSLLESTWNAEYLPRLLMERVRMSKSAHETLLGGTPIAVLTQEALVSRNLLVDEVVRIQGKLKETQDELDKISQQCRQEQGENRALWKNIQCKDNRSKQTDTSSSCSDTVRKNLLLKRVLADLIVGANLDLFNDVRLAATFLKLE